MKVVKNIKYIGILFILFLFTSTIHVASSAVLKQQTAYTVELLNKFIKATKKVSLIQQEGEQKMVQAIEQEDLDVDTFNKIAEMMINPESAEKIDVTPEQMDSFTKVLEKLQGLQFEIQQEMEAAIIDNGIAIEDYQKIVEEYHNNPSFQQQINEMLQE
ncbi:MAG: DUF4168 domain-containing protein [Bacteroidetes bacterium]|nr:DUF4168 domain-containing protein [Bacteroidota bacterium]HET6245936.1 DUF4168 domain-containing protein [Bacteroidia bacterium]